MKNHPKQSTTQFKSKIIGKFPHQYRVFPFCNDNFELYEMLATDGFFKFHTTNHLQLVSEHQITAYYYCGGIYAYRNGFTCEQHKHEIHHIDGNGLNNQPSNLVYLTTSMHQEITGHQRVLSGRYRVFGINKKSRYQVAAKLNSETIWGRNGKEINIIDKLVTVLSNTLIKTAEFNDQITCKFNLKKWLENVETKLRQGLTSLLENINFIYEFV